MEASQPHRAYKQVHVETASQGKLIVMLYDAAIKRTEEAVNQLGGARKLDVISNNLIRAQDIIAELRASLNMKAGEIAANLDNVYDYIHRLLIRGNVRKQKAPLEEAVRLMRMLRNTWKELFENLPASEVPSTSPEVARGTVMLNVHG